MTHAHATVQRVICDGCGQGTPSEHIARRLERLEQTTRYRPVHIQTVFLSAQSPGHQDAFLYGVENGFQGEAAALLNALQVEWEGRAADAVLSEFQRKGFFLTHVLECGEDLSVASQDLSKALKEKLPSVLRRMRTSLKPKRLIAISKGLTSVAEHLKTGQIAAQVVLDGDAPFELEDAASVNRLRSVL